MTTKFEIFPSIDNPNILNKFGRAPIHRAAVNGHIEIVKILVNFSENLDDVPHYLGMMGGCSIRSNAISIADANGHTEIGM